MIKNLNTISEKWHAKSWISKINKLCLSVSHFHILSFYPSRAGLDGRQAAVEHENGPWRHNEHHKRGAELQLVARPAVDWRIGEQSHQCHHHHDVDGQRQDANGDDLLTNQPKTNHHTYGQGSIRTATAMMKRFGSGFWNEEARAQTQYVAAMDYVIERIYYIYFYIYSSYTSRTNTHQTTHARIKQNILFIIYCWSRTSFSF